jgi:phage gp36-like protein
MFATRADLLARSNAMRLAQLAVPADHEFPCSGKALRELIEGADIATFPAEEQAALVSALDAIDKALSDADELLISYGIPPEIQTKILARLASTVALYYLQGSENMTETVEKAYREVLRLLDRYQAGELPGLIPLDPDQPGGAAIIESAPRRYR